MDLWMQLDPAVGKVCIWNISQGTGESMDPLSKGILMEEE